MPITPKAKKTELQENPFQDVQVERSGKLITLPSDPRDMEIQEAIDALRGIQADEEAETSINHEIECFPLDGLVNFNRACLEEFGIAIGTPTPGFWGPTPPTMMTVPIGHNAKTQVPWGNISFPQLKDSVLTTVIPGKGNTKPKFIIGGTILKKYQKSVQNIAARTEKNLREKSIYKGKAIKVSFAWMREGRDFHPTNDAPTFLDVSNARKDNLVFGKEVADLIQTGLFSAIEKTGAFREFGIPLKRGVLLTGPYGCGKTLTAYTTAKICEDNGWTFMYVSNVEDLPIALKYAKLYSPCVIFAEDVDIATNGPRSTQLNELLNTIDGADYKDAEIITILTTNHAENINRAFLRPGRIDTVIPVEPPDREATLRLIQKYGGDLLAVGTDLNPAAEFLAGQIPATIRECVERSKISALTRTNDITGQVTSEDLIIAMKGMEPHMRLLNGAKTGDGPSVMEVGLACLGAGIGRGIAATGGANLPPVLKQIADLAVTETLMKFLQVANADGTGQPFKSAEDVKKMGLNLNSVKAPPIGAVVKS